MKSLFVKRRASMRRVLLSALAACMLIVSVSAPAEDSYPLKPIRILVGFNAAGGTDTIARYYAMKLSQVLKTSVYVENRPGAYQMIAIRSLMAAPADGYTLFLISGSAISQYPGLQSDLPYQPSRDFSMIALVALSPGVIVASPALPVRNIADLIAYCKPRPTAINFGSSGIGSASHLQLEYLSYLAGIRMTQIPYKADAEVITSIAAGSVQLGMTPVQGALPAIKAGLVRPLAVTGMKRISALPDVPSLGESGFPQLGSVDPYTYYVLVGGKGLPREAIDKLNAAVNAVSKMPETISYMHGLAYEPSISTPQSVASYVAQDTQKWSKFKKDSHLQLQIWQ
jgi:tripartite-type tricarboxylate transporter receptor subunit TctC